MSRRTKLRVVSGLQTRDRASELERRKLYGGLPTRRAAEFLDRLRDAVYLLDDGWRFTFINRAAGTAWRRDRAGLIGKCIWDAFPQTVGSEARAMHETALRERRPIRFETISPVLGGLIHVSIRPLDHGLPGCGLGGHGLGVSFRQIERPGKRGRVLVVDDKDDIRELLQLSLEQEDYLVMAADDLDIAETAVALLPIDVILLDDRLPGGRGSSLHGRAAERGMPLLIMSGHPTTIEQFGDAAHFLAKPFRLPVLLERLDRLLKNSQ